MKLTQKQLERMPEGTLMVWKRGIELDHGSLFHSAEGTFIQWPDGQRTYASDDAALNYVYLYSEAEDK